MDTNCDIMTLDTGDSSDYGYEVSEGLLFYKR